MRPLPLPLWALISAHLSLAEQQTPLQQPTAIRKMPPNNPSLKFHSHFCAFDPSQTSPSNSSAAVLLPRDGTSFSAPLRAVYNPPPPASPNPQRRGVLGVSKRQWSCPTDTLLCSNIGYPNTCCHEGSTCIKIPDTGLGPVGCCPDNTQCTGGVTSCGEGGVGCPSEVGGGCCLKGWVCGGLVFHFLFPSQLQPRPRLRWRQPTTTTSESSSTPETTSTRPQSSTTTSDDAPETSTTGEPGFCPTGYYACLARANNEGGCCQIGRGCAETDCPPLTSSTTVVDGNGVTIAVPMPTGAPPVMGDECANGWFMCNERDESEGCCPDGYGCGTASCTLVRAGETAGVAKALPGTGAAVRYEGAFVGALVGVAGMVMAF
ncbi:uncharacterized protein PODANS_2_1080 [Podospora anserina S mat+]|uniref:Podospora anserina S mat+ genomic DNA chromosome 2, supercontig 2 n=1 Tax=Podospora anserina (strain S / ATCC MYA-4624 / DSM 980 / FGSC 10383) TaxID=515849 RepID=B2B4F2_PODAN|nr:uncharacterized protein PODANS_2_1080 [Podospora anserina S mat+]CAP72677.1 unnamed protein product [Podospora anserina S mat+]